MKNDDGIECPNIDVLEQMEATTKRGAKELILSRANGFLKRLLEQALDGNVTYGVTVDEDDAKRAWDLYGSNGSTEDFWISAEEFMHDCKKRELTGNAAEDALQDLAKRAPSPRDLKWFCRLLNRNLRAGFDIRTFNKVFGVGAIEKFSVQLAQQYEGQELAGYWFFQPKLDGNRVIMIDGLAMSRNGKEYPNCGHVIAELIASDPDFFDKWVVDGEMMGDLGFDQSSGALRRISQDGRKQATFTYWAFDLIQRDEWDRRQTRQLNARTDDLIRNIGGEKFKTIKVVPTEQIIDPTHKQVMDICRQYMDLGFEGAMAKDALSPYVFDRGPNLLKVKFFYEDDFEVVSLYEGKGQHKGSLGGLVVKGDIKWGHVGKPQLPYTINCKVGSGFATKKTPQNPNVITRQEIWDSKKDWVGATVQVQFQEATKKGSLRFPVFIMRRKDKE